MSYPQSGPPHHPDGSRTLLNFSGAALIWVVIGALGLCVGLPIVGCLIFLFVDPSSLP